jgi:hypothetical protein
MTRNSENNVGMFRATEGEVRNRVRFLPFLGGALRLSALSEALPASVVGRFSLVVFGKSRSLMDRKREIRA